MNSKENLIESLVERVESYGKTTYELSKLKLLNTTVIVLPSLISRLVTILMFTLFTLVLNLGIALFLGELLGKLYYGFFIVAAFYLVVGFILHFFLHNWIRKPISNLIIKQALQ
ncbi:MAG TPA: hypothetical protein DCG69_03110 [Bacteroidales bacterium]|nr:hypothetical protein [Bacteroidales bacterium]